jgi:hypothetical protein
MSLSLSTQSHTTLSLNHMAMEASPVVTDTDMEANLAREARVEDTITLSHRRHPDRSLSRSHIIPLDTGSMSQDLIQNRSQNPSQCTTAARVERVERVVDMDTVNMEVIMDTDTAARVARVATAVVMEAREASRVVDAPLSHRLLSLSLNQEVGVTSLLTLLTQIMKSITPATMKSTTHTTMKEAGMAGMTLMRCTTSSSQTTAPYPSLFIQMLLNLDLNHIITTEASLARVVDTVMEAREASREDITLTLTLTLSQGQLCMSMCLLRPVFLHGIHTLTQSQSLNPSQSPSQSQCTMARVERVDMVTGTDHKLYRP